jgi:hypothetical protein
MRRLVATSVLVLLTSCVPAASATPTPKSTASPPIPPAAPVTSELPTARIHRKLPIGFGRSLSGFITYPDGTFTPDLTSDPATNPYRGPNTSSIGRTFTPTYDWPAGRWLPIPRPLLSSDGATYAHDERGLWSDSRQRTRPGADWDADSRRRCGHEQEPHPNRRTYILVRCRLPESARLYDASLLRGMRQ